MPNYDLEILKTVSHECIDLMKKMLESMSKKRFNAIECLNHPWFNKFNSANQHLHKDSVSGKCCLSNLKNFKGRLKMQ